MDRTFDFSDTASNTEAKRLGKLYPIILCAHDPAYQMLFEAERALLCDIFGDHVLRISHIGSTAVPGLIAKPCIDILLEVKENTNLFDMTERMQAMGYMVNMPPKDKILYIKGYAAHGFEGQAFHVHVRALGDHDELYFRDYLLAHPEIRQLYGEQKRKLQARYEHDRDGYTHAKSAFIRKYTNAARAEFAGRYEP